MELLVSKVLLECKDLLVQYDLKACKVFKALDVIVDLLAWEVIQVVKELLVKLDPKG